MLLFIIVEEVLVVKNIIFLLLRNGKELLLIKVNYIKCNHSKM